MNSTRIHLLWLLPVFGLPLWHSTSPVRSQQADASSLAAQAQGILRKHCFQCHGQDEKKLKGNLNVTEHAALLDQKRDPILIKPNKPEESELFLQVKEERMPPGKLPKLSAEELQVLQDWIAAGAPAVGAIKNNGPVVPAQPEVLKQALGDEYVLASIVQDVRRLSAANRRFVRYLSLTHILNAGTTKDDLNLYRDALAKAVNHLSWKPNLVRPVAIESTQTVYRIDLRELGWEQQVFNKVEKGKEVGPSTVNIYDLALIEYPYGIIQNRSQNYYLLLKEFLIPAGQVRPIPFVRADWFVSVVTQPPLYHDFLKLPRTLGELEKILGVNADANVTNGTAVRGGVINSGVSRNNRP